MDVEFSDLSITPRLIASELTRRGVEFTIIGKGTSYALFEYQDTSGVKRLCRNVTTDSESALAKKIADNKYDTHLIAKKLGIKTPDTCIYSHEAQAKLFLDKNNKIVVKPLDSSHGNGITIDINNIIKLRSALHVANNFSNVLLLQQQINVQSDIRLLFIDGKFRAATKRIPAFVIGDGIHTIEQLIEIENQPTKRSVGYSEMPCVIPSVAAANFLGSRFKNEIPSFATHTQVVGTANIGTGGLAENMTDVISSEMITSAEKIVNELRMSVCGVDFLVDTKGDFYLIEVNASPSFGLHHFPTIGASVDVTSFFVDSILQPRLQN